MQVTIAIFLCLSSILSFAFITKASDKAETWQTFILSAFGLMANALIGAVSGLFAISNIVSQF
jgi:hypothetical protein